VSRFVDVLDFGALWCRAAQAMPVFDKDLTALLVIDATTRFSRGATSLLLG